MNSQLPASLAKLAYWLNILAFTTCVTSGVMFILSLLDLGSVSLYTFPPSAAITGVYYAMALWHALWNTRSRNPLWFYTSVFALILPWGIICLDSVGLAFVSYLLGIPLKDIKAGVFTDLFPVRGICNGRTVVAELVFAAMQMVLVIALFAVGVVARRRARAIQPIVDKP